jgi:hypothetical protein
MGEKKELRPFTMQDFKPVECETSVQPLLLVNGLCRVYSNESIEDCKRLLRAVCRMWMALEIQKEGLKPQHHAMRRGSLVRYTRYAAYQWGPRLTKAAKILRDQVDPGIYKACIEILGNRIDFSR